MRLCLHPQILLMYLPNRFDRIDCISSCTRSLEFPEMLFNRFCPLSRSSAVLINIASGNNWPRILWRRASSAYSFQRKMATEFLTQTIFKRSGLSSGIVRKCTRNHGRLLQRNLFKNTLQKSFSFLFLKGWNFFAIRLYFSLWFLVFFWMRRLPILERFPGWLEQDCVGLLKMKQIGPVSSTILTMKI
jgi:hypothetical protein